MSLSFCWLGVAGLAIKADGQVLAIDPFFTRPSLLDLMRPLVSKPHLVQQWLPVCDFVLVTHAHYDHLMDVPEVARITGAAVYGSPNTCQILDRLDIPSEQLHKVGVGAVLSLGQFEVEVVGGQHSPIPLGWLFNGLFKPGARLPLHAWDYKMDITLGYRITVHGVSFLVCSADPIQAEVLFVVAQEERNYYKKMFAGVHPLSLVPIHWDNFTRPLSKPLHRFTRPGRISLEKLAAMAQETIPGCNVIIPELFKDYLIKTP